MRKNEEVWEIYVGTNNKDTINEHELEVIESFKSKYRRKHGLYNRSIERMNLVSLLLRELALGNLDNLESPKAVDLIKSNPLFKKLGESNG